MSRLGLYGGSFDPIHNGHVEPVIHAADQFQLERVLYLPTAHPPHKPDLSFAAPLRRFAMVELAVLGDERLQVSAFELTAGPSFTIDTIEHIQREEPDAALHLILGSDSLAQIESWRRWSDILDSVHLLVLRRPGWSRDEVLARLSPTIRQRLAGDRNSFVDNTPLKISATEIRRRLAAGEDVPAEWMPPTVVEYARKYCLYS